MPPKSKIEHVDGVHCTFNTKSGIVVVGTGLVSNDKRDTFKLKASGGSLAEQVRARPRFIEYFKPLLAALADHGAAQSASAAASSAAEPSSPAAAASSAASSSAASSSTAASAAASSAASQPASLPLLPPPRPLKREMDALARDGRAKRPRITGWQSQGSRAGCRRFCELCMREGRCPGTSSTSHELCRGAGGATYEDCEPLRGIDGSQADVVECLTCGLALCDVVCEHRKPCPDHGCHAFDRDLLLPRLADALAGRGCPCACCKFLPACLAACGLDASDLHDPQPGLYKESEPVAAATRSWRQQVRQALAAVGNPPCELRDLLEQCEACTGSCGLELVNGYVCG